MHWRNINPFLLLLWITAYHQNSFLTRPATPPRAAIRSWTQLLIVWRLNLVCHQIPVGGRDEDVVQRAGRPFRRLRLTPTDTSSRKSHLQFPLKPRGLASFGTLTPHVVGDFFSSWEKWLCGNVKARSVSLQDSRLIGENLSCFCFQVSTYSEACLTVEHLLEHVFCVLLRWPKNNPERPFSCLHVAEFLESNKKSCRRNRWSLQVYGDSIYFVQIFKLLHKKPSCQIRP